MGSAKQVLYFSDDFKETCTTHYIDPAALLQMTMKLTCFYLEVQVLYNQVETNLVDRMIVGLTHYQKSGKQWFDKNLARINAKHMTKLLVQCSNSTLSEKQHVRNAIRMMKTWEKDADQLLEYPRELTLETGEVFNVPFDFFLLAVLQNQTVKAYLKFHMERISLANYTAYLNSRKQKEKDKIQMLVRDLQQLEGVFLARTPAQQQLFIAQRLAYDQLVERLHPIKSAQIRYPLIRAFMKDWYLKILGQDG